MRDTANIILNQLDVAGRKKVYLCHPLTADFEDNYKRCVNIARYLHDDVKVTPIVPEVGQDAYIEGWFDNMRAACHKLLDCDFCLVVHYDDILRYPNKTLSIGQKVEIEICSIKQIPVVFVSPDQLFTEHCSKYLSRRFYDQTSHSALH